MGQVRVGELVDTLTYPGFWLMAHRYRWTGIGEFYRSLVKRAFVRALQKLVPALQSDDIVRGGAGIRAQAVSPNGDLLDDFHIQQGPWAIHVLNAPSPAATASMAIGEYIAGQAATPFGLRS